MVPRAMAVDLEKRGFEGCLGVELMGLGVRGGEGRAVSSLGRGRGSGTEP